MENFESKKKVEKWIKKLEQHRNYCKKQALKWKKTMKPVDQAISYEIAGQVLVELGYSAGAKNHPLKGIRKGYHRLKESYWWRFKKE